MLCQLRQPFNDQPSRYRIDLLAILLVLAERSHGLTGHAEAYHMIQALTRYLPWSSESCHSAGTLIGRRGIAQAKKVETLLDKEIRWIYALGHGGSALNRRDVILEVIAQQHLRVDTLVTRNSDGQDFYDVPVWRLREALRAAYAAGMEAAAQHGQHTDEARALRQVEMTRAPR